MSKVFNVLPIVQSKKKLGIVVAYYPFIAKVLCSTDATILVCQFIHWCESFEDEEQNFSLWEKKTANEIYDATGIGHNSQVTARKVLKDCGILTEKLFGNPATMHYKFDFWRLNELLTIGEPLKKSAKNPNQAKDESGKFESVSESIGNKFLTPIIREQVSDKVPNLVSDTFGNLNPTFSETTYKEPFIKRIKESSKEKNSLTFEKSETSKQDVKTVNASMPGENPKAIVPASCKSDTKTLYRMIENKEELAKVTEQVIIANVESFKMFYESKGFKEKNAFHYAVDFAQYFFTKFPLCSLSDEKIKDQLCTWYFIFNNANEAIAKNKKVEDLGLPFAERQAKEAAAVQQAKPQATPNSHLSKFEQMVKEKNRLAFKESQK